MKLYQLFGMAVAFVALAGCDASINPQSTQSVGVDAQVSRLFEIDGCRVYRFLDAGRYRYFANCGDLTTTSSSYSQSSGKTTSHYTEEISAFTPAAKYEP